MFSKFRQAPLIGVIVTGVLALVMSAIIVYAVAFPVLTQLNSSGVIPASQNANFGTVLLLMGVMVLIVALVIFMIISRLAG